MKRVVKWLIVAALMAALMGATAVPAFTDIGKRQALCGEVAQPGYVTNNPKPGLDIKAGIDILQEQGSSEGESIRGNASACNEGEGPPLP